MIRSTSCQPAKQSIIYPPNYRPPEFNQLLSKLAQYSQPQLPQQYLMQQPPQMVCSPQYFPAQQDYPSPSKNPTKSKGFWNCFKHDAKKEQQTERRLNESYKRKEDENYMRSTPHSIIPIGSPPVNMMSPFIPQTSVNISMHQIIQPSRVLPMKFIQIIPSMTYTTYQTPIQKPAFSSYMPGQSQQYEGVNAMMDQHQDGNVRGSFKSVRIKNKSVDDFRKKI